MNITTRVPKIHRAGGDAAAVRKQLLEKRVRNAGQNVISGVRDWAVSWSAAKGTA